MTSRATLQELPDKPKSSSKSLSGATPQRLAHVNGVLIWKPPTLAIVGALLAWSASLVPSLLPRPWLLQGSISAVAILVGYLVGHLTSKVASPVTRMIGSGISTRIRIALLVSAGGLLVWTNFLHYIWRSDIRRLMDMDGIVALYSLAAFVAATALGYLLLIAARLSLVIWKAAFGFLVRRMPAPLATSLALLALILIGVLGFDVLIAGGLVGAIDDGYLDATFSYDEDVVQPSVSTLAGGPGSLIEWEEIGLQGREFVASARSRTELEDFNGRPSKDPIRVYAGLRSADSANERARLAVDDLERAGGFERAVIVMITPTGTGWIDPYAIDPIEFIFNGDTAAVAVQYSHLPSWVLLIGNQDLAIESSQTLFDAISEKLATIEEQERPLLLLYGESLGSFALEAMFTDLDDLRGQTDGVLWVGPSRTNRLWQQLMAQRSGDTPEWRPIVGDGEAVRFGRDGEALSAVAGTWKAPRVAYLQHASDPITWLSTDLILKRPEWLDPPRGSDVSRWMPYIPGVTFLQVLTDLVMGTNAPVGHGHKFGATQAEAWALVVSPEPWSTADTERLRDVIEDDLGDTP